MTFLGLLTQLHTSVSLVAILAGVFAVHDLFRGETTPFWTRVFIGTALATSVSGFFFPPAGLTPAHVIGIVALAILAVVLLAFYRFALQGVWRGIYAAGLVVSLYLLVLVAIVQAFQKLPVLHAFAPTGSEPPVIAAQLVALVACVGTAILAALRFRPVVADSAA